MLIFSPFVVEKPANGVCRIFRFFYFDFWMMIFVALSGYTFMFVFSFMILVVLILRDDNFCFDLIIVYCVILCFLQGLLYPIPFLRGYRWEKRNLICLLENQKYLLWSLLRTVFLLLRTVFLKQYAQLKIDFLLLLFILIMRCWS